MTNPRPNPSIRGHRARSSSDLGLLVTFVLLLSACGGTAPRSDAIATDTRGGEIATDTRGGDGDVALPAAFDPCSAGRANCDGDAANGCETSAPCQAVMVARGVGSAVGIAVDETSVYWASPSPGAIYKAPKAGGVAEAVADNQFGAFDIAVDADNIYWSLYGDNNQAPGHTVLAMPKGGGAPKVLATIAGNPGGIARHGTDLHFTAVFGGLYKVPVAGGETTTVIASLPGRNLGRSVDASNSYLSSVNTTPTPSVVSRRRDAGAATTLADGLSYPLQLARDAHYVYVADYKLGVYRVPSSGGAKQRLLSLAGAEGVAVDDRFAYYTIYATGAMATAKQTSAAAAPRASPALRRMEPASAPSHSGRANYPTPAAGGRIPPIGRPSSTPTSMATARRTSAAALSTASIARCRAGAPSLPTCSGRASSPTLPPGTPIPPTGPPSSSPTSMATARPTSAPAAPPASPALCRAGAASARSHSGTARCPTRTAGTCPTSGGPSRSAAATRGRARSAAP